MKKILIFIILFSQISYICSQNWEHVYTDEFFTNSPHIIEDYDKGTLFVTSVSKNSLGQYSRLNKTNTNGKLIWSKSIGSFENEMAINAVELLDDGGLLLAGGEMKFTNSYRSFLIKLNPCREVEWLKIYGDTLHLDYMTDILVLEDGNYLISGRYIGVEQISIFKINPKGETLWRKNFLKHGYDADIGEYSSAHLTSIKQTKDKGFVLGGKLYVQDASTYFIIRSFVLKIDENGNKEWIYIHGIDSNIRSQDAQVLETKSGYLAGVTQRSPGTQAAWSMMLYKLDNYGQLEWTKPIGDTILKTAIIGMEQINDTLYLASNVTKGSIFQPEDGYQSYIKMFKLDSLGVFIDTAIYGKDTIKNTKPLGFTKTLDNKLLLTGFQDSVTYNAYTIKVLKNLSIDTFVVDNFTYDYKCDKTIESGSLPFVSAIFRLQKDDIVIKSFPNPTRQYFNIVIEDVFKSYNCKIYSLNGALIYEEKDIKEKEHKFIVDFLSKGMYFYTLDFGNGYVFNSKFIKK